MPDNENRSEAPGASDKPPLDNDTGKGAPGAPGANGGDSGGSEDDATPGSNREAAYRIRARNAEATVTALQERVTKMQRREVERAAAALRMQDPADVWRYDVDLVELLDEESGDLDEERVADALAALADSKPHLFGRGKQQQHTPGFGQGNGHAQSMPEGTGATWSQVLSTGPS